MAFAAPVPVSAGAVYVASYTAPAGGYAASAGLHASAIDSPPLHALADAESPNGAFGAPDAFPASSFNATGYGVDVVFRAANDQRRRILISADASEIGVCSLAQVGINQKWLAVVRGEDDVNVNLRE